MSVIIIGGGAAGTYCAIHAAQRGLSVCILEKNPAIGAKLRVCGGGRCNFTNLHIKPEAYLSHNPHFCRSALAKHNQWDVLKWFDEHRLTYHEKKSGQLFCAQHSRGVIQALADELHHFGVPIHYNTCVLHIEKTENGYLLHTNQGDFAAEQLVIACGGASFAKLGATDCALTFAKSLKIANYPFRPALVPLLLSPAFPQLAGVTTEVIVKTENAPDFRDDMLFTHRGLSGPAILQISSYWQKGAALELNFLPDCPPDFLLTTKQQQPQKSLSHVLKTLLPAALVQHFIPNQQPLQQYSDAQLRAYTQQLQHYRVLPSGTEGMKKAEVCRGGIDTRTMDPRTLQIKAHADLYAIGEAVDVTGWLGGYNLQWAWSSAWCCAQALRL